MRGTSAPAAVRRPTAVRERRRAGCGRPAPCASPSSACPAPARPRVFNAVADRARRRAARHRPDGDARPGREGAGPASRPLPRDLPAEEVHAGGPRAVGPAGRARRAAASATRRSGSALLASLREADAYVLVVRGVRDATAMPTSASAPDPAADLERLVEELVTADFVVAEGRMPALRGEPQARRPLEGRGPARARRPREVRRPARGGAGPDRPRTRRGRREAHPRLPVLRAQAARCSS